jgi:DNA (cytosine-5)-methyltransferase 1
MLKQNNFTFIDLFSGIGGFRLALNNLGGSCVNFSEINKDAIDAYCTNFDEETAYNLGDITKIKALPKHDFMTAGVPCQSWSIAGRNLGFDDDRGQLWNDTIYLLNQSKPKAFIFENVKGLVDPRNQDALSYILERVRAAGYHAHYYVLNSFDYGVPQNRVRIYIVGFLEKTFHDKFQIAAPVTDKIRLEDVLLDIKSIDNQTLTSDNQKDLFGQTVMPRNMGLSNNKGFNDYFLFNDLRNGHSTIHSWDILETTEYQKSICYLLLKNRRKSAYGDLDGNPLSLAHFKALDGSIALSDLEELVKIGILKEEEYTFTIIGNDLDNLDEAETAVLECAVGADLNIDVVKNNRQLKLDKRPIFKIVDSLKRKNIIKCIEKRYDFKNTKISTGLYGVNRIFLPSSNIFPTLVASDSNDFVALEDINADNAATYKTDFLNNIYRKGKYRKITKEEACQMQGFPQNFMLPTSRARWIKLLGNSVSVPVVQMLGQAIIATGVFDENVNNSQYLQKEMYEIV